MCRDSRKDSTTNGSVAQVQRLPETSPGIVAVECVQNVMRLHVWKGEADLLPQTMSAVTLNDVRRTKRHCGYSRHIGYLRNPRALIRSIT